MRGYVWGVAAPLACSLLYWPLQKWVGPASILMSYLLAVFMVAMRFGRGPSVLSSLLSAPVFAFYFARPIFSFAVHDLENIIGLAVMVIVANVTGNLLEISRLQAELARQREARTAALYRLSRDLSDARDQDAVRLIAEEHIRNEFGVSSVLLINADTDNRLQMPSNPSGSESSTQVDLCLSQRIFENREVSYENHIAHVPLKGVNDWHGILIIQPAECILHICQDAEPSAFFDTFCHLIGQSLERLQLEAQAQEARLQAEAEALRNALLSSISHDLRTPLTRITGAASALIEGDSELSTSERLDFNRVILDEAQRMSELTGKLLDMARLSSGKITLHRDWNALEEIVGSALNRLDKQLEGRPIRIMLSDSLPLLWIDAVLIEQVLINLIENASKYSPTGHPIDIGGNVLEGYCRISIVDYGPGIPEGQEIRVFEKFYRGVSESDQGGVGLGLALCKAIVESHGGSIRAANRIGKGAEFMIMLPIREPPCVAQPNDREVSHDRG